MSTTNHNPLPASHRVDLIVRLTVVAELLMIASTWRLWFCATDFPRVPLFTLLLPTPTILVQAISLAFVAALMVAAVSGWRQCQLPGRTATTAALVLGCIAVCCNQHYLQPWHWLFLLTMAFRLAVPAEHLRLVLQRLLPCIYIFAAVSRFGPEINSGMSRRIVMTILDLTGLQTVAAESHVVSWLCVAMTLIELTTGLLLVRRRTQRTGLAIAVFMHLTLIVVLSPLGLNQHATVMIWNGLLAAWALQLFAKNTKKPQHRCYSKTLATAFCFIWPLLALFGLTDNWTGWQVYSPRPEVLQLQLHTDAVHQLPLSLRPYVEEPNPLEEWCSVRLDRWSLQNTGVPLYPQARFQLSIATAATASISSPKHVRARLTSPARLKWWNRTTTVFAGGSELKRIAAENPSSVLSVERD
jgi:hypothetical protein